LEKIGKFCMNAIIGVKNYVHCMPMILDKVAYDRWVERSNKDRQLLKSCTEYTDKKENEILL
jgi:hypothetical protein